MAVLSEGGGYGYFENQDIEDVVEARKHSLDWSLLEIGRVRKFTG